MPSKNGCLFRDLISWPVMGQPSLSSGSSCINLSIRSLQSWSICIFFGQSILRYSIYGKQDASFIPGKGTFPVYILNIIHPNAHRSEEQVASHSLIISGAK